MARSRDSVIDKKFGSVVRLRRVKLRMSQSELGAALGVTFQQIQKYEQGKNAIASTRIPDLCRSVRTDAERFVWGECQDGRRANYAKFLDDENQR